MGSGAHSQQKYGSALNGNISVFLDLFSANLKPVGEPDLKHVQTQVLIIFLVSGAYTLSFGLMDTVIAPLQAALAPTLTEYALLIFLPHGVRVLTAWLFGWRSIFYLLAAAIIAHLIVTPEVAISGTKISTWLVGASCGWLGIATLRLLGLPLGEDLASIGRDTWRHLILAGVTSSLFNSIGHGLVYQSEVFSDLFRPVVFAFIFGDTMGILLCFALAFAFLRVSRRLKRL